MYKFRGRRCRIKNCDLIKTVIFLLSQYILILFSSSVIESINDENKAKPRECDLPLCQNKREYLGLSFIYIKDLKGIYIFHILSYECNTLLYSLDQKT
jgi:hypothetical protein